MRALSIAILAFFISPGPVFGLTSFDEVKAEYRSSDAMLLDRHGEVIYEMRVDARARKLAWVNLHDISPALVKAVVKSEDKRFYDHHGVDWKALAYATFNNLVSNRKRGASTITMQLAGLHDKKLKSKMGKRSLGQKWDQIQAAQEIERVWTKEQIFEAYLNLVSFRGELQGIAAASRGIFDKEPNGLDDAESAVLAALIRSPNADSRKVGERAELLAASLGSSVSTTKIRQLAIDRLSKPPHVRKSIDLAPHVAQRLLHNGEEKAISTIDARLQRYAIDALSQALGALSDKNVSDGAILVVDNRSGDVLAYVGNSGQASSAKYIDGIQARRQAGSTLKPFLYALALEKKILTAASLLEDAPLDVPTERGLYRPENYDKTYRGLVSARTALASSLNVPAVRTAGLVGTGVFVEKLISLGFTNLREAEDYGPSLALGTADISLWELVNAYRTLANEGVRSSLRLLPGQRNSFGRRVISEEATFIISDILSDREARSTTFTLESPLSTRFWTAVKTGTSKDMRDNWCVGYSERYTVGVWVGNFSGAAMWNVSGVSGAAPIWLEIMNYLHSQTPSRAPSVPKGIVPCKVNCADGNVICDKPEYFITGTEQESIKPHSAEIRPKIIYPVMDTVIAIDPDIPKGLQKVYFEASSADPSYNIVLDDVLLGPVPSVSWSPVPGKHQLFLIARDGNIEDQITFEVK